MIKIFHESPKALFEESRSYNDYIYILQPFLEDKEYYDFVVSEIKAGKEVIFDNGAFEMELNIPVAEVFAENIKKLSSFAPDKSKFYFIVNDYLDDKDRTIQSMEDWIKTYGNLGCKIIGSIQGKTMEELEDCFEYMQKTSLVDKIAITYNSEGYLAAYNDICQDKDICFKYGRRELLCRLARKYNNNLKPLHLLGCSLASEFNVGWYKEIPIDSVDTSLPIVCGLEGQIFSNKMGMGNLTKPKAKMMNLLEVIPSDAVLEIIRFNIKTFREIVE